MNYSRTFDQFDPQRIARYTRRRIDTLLGNPCIIRKRLKIEATINNANRFLELRASEGLFDVFIWQFVDCRTRHNRRRSQKQLPASTGQSDAMSKALRAHGFRFTGSTVCYAYMQAAGLVNDHVTCCVRHRQTLDLHTLRKQHILIKTDSGFRLFTGFWRNRCLIVFSCLFCDLGHRFQPPAPKYNCDCCHTAICLHNTEIILAIWLQIP